MKVKKESVIKMFVELGVESATTWSDKRIVDRIKTLPKFTESDEVPEPESDESKSLLKSLLKALKAGEEDFEVSGKAKAEAEKPAKAAAKAEADDEDEDDSEDEDSDDDSEVEDEEDDDDESEEATESEDEDSDDEVVPVKQPKKKGDKKGKKKAAGGTKRVGVVNAIAEMLLAANKDKPISKEKILDKLCAKFPDRPRDSMKATVNAQTGYHLHHNRGLRIYKVEGKGLYAKQGQKPDKNDPKPAKKRKEAVEA